MKEPVLFKNLNELFAESQGAPADSANTYVCAVGTKTSRLKEWTFPKGAFETAIPFVEKISIIAKEDSELEYVFFQNFPTTENAPVSAAAKIVVEVKKNAKVKLTIIQNGASRSHVEVETHCDGEGADVEVRGLQNARGEQKFSMNVNAIHSIPHTRSNLSVWCVARDRSHSIFNALVTIKEGAHHTEAYQRNRNLILSDKAVVDSFPKLWIANDEVKCAHGSSTSTLDPDQALYLQTRGISHDAAEKMLTSGFINQSLSWLSDLEMKGMLENALGTAGNEEDAL